MAIGPGSFETRAIKPRPIIRSPRTDISHLRCVIANCDTGPLQILGFTINRTNFGLRLFNAFLTCVDVPAFPATLKAVASHRLGLPLLSGLKTIRHRLCQPTVFYDL